MDSATTQDSKLGPIGRLWMWIALILALAGAGVSAYSINHHLQAKAFGKTNAACNISDKLSCDAAALSDFSEIAGIPLGVYGLGYFAAMGVLALLAMFGGKTANEHHHAYVAMVGIGVVTSLALAVVAFTSVGAMCPTCLVIYGVTALQAGALFAFRKETPAGFESKGVFSGGMSAAIAVAVVVAGFSLMRDQLGPSAAEIAARKELDKPQLAPATIEIPVHRSAYAGLGEDYRKGPDNAAIVIVEFADFQCPACKAMSPVLDQLVIEFPGRVQKVFRNYPLDNTCNASMQGQAHDKACKAAVMARCAGQYGKFWEYHDLLFENQKQISEANMKGWAKQVGISDEQIESCWTSKDLLAKIQEDAELGTKLGVDSTPTIFINGRKVLGGGGLDDLRYQIQQLMN